MVPPLAALRIVRTVHTIVWAFFVTCIVAIPIMAWHERHTAAFVLALVVFVECVVLLFNHWRCPLTDVAARYTADRRDNFDIYLPEWLARLNKHVFGGLYVAGIVYALARWRGWT